MNRVYLLGNIGTFSVRRMCLEGHGCKHVSDHIYRRLGMQESDDQKKIAPPIQGPRNWINYSFK